MSTAEDLENPEKYLVRVPTRQNLGYGDWRLNKVLAAATPISLGIFLAALIGAALLWIILGVLVAAFLTLFPPIRKGEYPYQSLIEWANGKYIAWYLKSEVLPPFDGSTDHRERPLVNLRPAMMEIVSDSDTSVGVNQVGFLEAEARLPKRDIFFLVVEPTRTAPFMGAQERYYWEMRFLAMVEAMAPFISAATSISAQVPFDLTPVMQHYRNSRFYYGPPQETNGHIVRRTPETIDPLQTAAIGQWQKLGLGVTALQPRTLRLLAIRPDRAYAWDGDRPAEMTVSHWQSAPIHTILTVAQNAAKRLGAAVRIANAPEMHLYLRACGDPVQAQAAYERWYFESRSGESVLDSSTYRLGPWPYRLRADKNGVQCGRTYNGFIEFTGYREGTHIPPDRLDTARLTWDQQAFICHFMDYQIGKATFERRKLEVITDVRDQLGGKDTVYRPKREEATAATRRAYKDVALANKVLRSSRYVRIGARGPKQRNWLIGLMQAELDRNGIDTERIEGASRNVKCLARSLGGGPQ